MGVGVRGWEWWSGGVVKSVVGIVGIKRNPMKTVHIRKNLKIAITMNNKKQDKVLLALLLVFVNLSQSSGMYTSL